MNNSKKLPIIIAAVVTVIALIVGGIFFLNQNKSGDNTPVPDSTTKPSSSASATPSPAASLNNEDETKAFEERKSYKDAGSVDNFSKEEVQEILKISNEYAYSSLTNGYFLGGEWVEAGMPNILDDAVGKFFDAPTRATIKSWDTNPKTGKDIGTNVMPLVFYVYPNGPVKAHEMCKSTGASGKDSPQEGIACPMTGLALSDMEYTPTKTGETPGVQVKFSATAKIPVKNGEKDAYSEVKYDYTLNFINNDNYEEATNPNKFVINTYNVQINMSAVVDLP